MRGNRKQGRVSGERGFALLALLAGLTIMLVLMSVAVPAIKHDLQRDQEEEMFWRGQQVAIGLAKFASLKGRLPTELKELGETFESPKGTMRVIRPSALCDPLQPCEDGKPNWKAVRPGDPLINEFYQAYLGEMMRNPERRLPPPSQQLAQMAQLSAQMINGLDASGQPGGQPTSEGGTQFMSGQGGPRTSEFSSQLKSEKGPIYGVVSKDQRPLIRNYFELASYDHALFFAGIAVSLPGIYNPLVFAPQQSGNQGGGRQNDPRCPNGGVYFEQNGKGFCGGVINQGRLCHGPDGTTIPCPDAPK